MSAIKFRISEAFKMFCIRKADVRQAKQLADIHASGFILPWDQSALRAFIEDNTVLPYIATDPTGHDIAGFILTRHVLDEADILTVAVTPKWQNNGIGYGLCHASMRYLLAQGVGKVHLEVNAQNHSAIKLYTKLGFKVVGKRANYYGVLRKGQREDALRMTLDMSSAFFQFEPVAYVVDHF